MTLLCCLVYDRSPVDRHEPVFYELGEVPAADVEVEVGAVDDPRLPGASRGGAQDVGHYVEVVPFHLLHHSLSW